MFTPAQLIYKQKALLPALVLCGCLLFFAASPAMSQSEQAIHSPIPDQIITGVMTYYPPIKDSQLEQSWVEQWNAQTQRIRSNTTMGEAEVAARLAKSDRFWQARINQIPTTGTFSLILYDQGQRYRFDVYKSVLETTESWRFHGGHRFDDGLIDADGNPLTVINRQDGGAGAFASDALRFLDYEALRPHYKRAEVVGENSEFLVFSGWIPPRKFSFPQDTTVTVKRDAKGRPVSISRADESGFPEWFEIEWEGDMISTMSMYNQFKDGRRKHKYVFSATSSMPIRPGMVVEPISWPVGSTISDRRFGIEQIQYPESAAMTDEELLKIYRRFSGAIRWWNSGGGREVVRWLGWGGAALIFLVWVLRARRRRRRVT